MDTEVPVVGGTIETEVDAKGNRRPGGVFGAAVETDLDGVNTVGHVECLVVGGAPCWPASASTSQRSSATASW